MEEKEEDAETVKKGGIYVICPLCLEKKKRGQKKVRMLLCCGQDVCLACCEAHEDACRVRSVEFTCPYCRAPFLDEDGAKLLLIKQGENIVLVLM